jgi:hypothetical protein
VYEASKGRTRRVQRLIEPAEYKRIEAIAERHGVPVAELMRAAVRAMHPPGPRDAQASVQRISSMDLPVDPWAVIKGEIAEAYDGGLP